MDLDKIFIRDACPTKVGGQAVLEGIMMKGATRSAVAVRLPDETIQLKIEENKPTGSLAKIPLVRGAVVFVASLVQGIRTLTYSADVLEAYERAHPVGAISEKEGGNGETVETDTDADEAPAKQGSFANSKLAWNLAMIASVVLALVFTILIFIVAPTVVIGGLKHVTQNEFLLNLAEGLLRIALFIGYVVLISRMEDIKNVFRYHGAEHKTIHCFENNLALTPENAQGFERLHPRCGTSFLVFVMIVALLLFSFLGWPNLAWRILSRVLLLPVIAGVSYELLRWAGRSDNLIVKILSIPGLLLQKITTAEPGTGQLQVAICAMKAVLTEEEPCGMWLCDAAGNILGPSTLDI